MLAACRPAAHSDGLDQALAPFLSVCGCMMLHHHANQRLQPRVLSTMLHHPVPAIHNASPGLRPFCDVTETAVPPLQAGVSGGAADECPGAPEVDDAAAYAVQQISSQSNSLFPYTLKKVRALCVCVPATAAPCCCHCTCYLLFRCLHFLHR